MLSEEEKKAIKYFKNRLKDVQTNYTSMYYKVDNLEILLNLIKKQNKIIDKMAEDIILLKECGWLTNITNKQDTIEFYTKLVEEENK